MSNESNTGFAFDPLPGDQAVKLPSETAQSQLSTEQPLVERKRRGPKPGSKRGPRHVISVTLQNGGPGTRAEAGVQTEPIPKRARKASVDAQIEQIISLILEIVAGAEKCVRAELLAKLTDE